MSLDWSMELPDDVTVEILCRLPEKPLIQFKCVSKNWYSLISNVCVPRIYASAPFSGLVFRWTTHYGADYYMDYAPSDGGSGGGFVESYSGLLPFQHTGEDVMDCCSGMILLSQRSSAPPVKYYVCNPATKQCIAIPVCPTHMELRFASLAFNPLESRHNRNSYKVVHLGHSAAIASVAHPPELDVFSSVTGKWVNHAIPLEPPLELYGFKWVHCSVYLDGLLYMLSSAMYLLCFDLINDNDDLNAMAIKLPEIARARSLPEKNMALDFGFIGVSNECLYYANHVETAVLVWSLESGCTKDGHQWALKHNICIDDLAQSPQGSILKRYRLSSGFMPYALHPTEEVIFLGIPRIIFSYHLKTNQFQVFRQLEEDRIIINGAYFVFPYSRCLVILNEFTPELQS